MIYYRKTLFGRGPKLTAVHFSARVCMEARGCQAANRFINKRISNGDNANVGDQ